MNKIIPLDYSQKANWCKLPQVTKEVDTFYVYATEYILGSMAEGAPDYADMNNQEMLEGAEAEYLLHASAYADADRYGKFRADSCRKKFVKFVFPTVIV